MASKRTPLIGYGVILVMSIAVPTFMVTFPEMADRLFAPLPFLVAAIGIGFVVASLLKRDLSFLVFGAGLLTEMSGVHYSNHWVIRLGILASGAGAIWMIKRQAARSSGRLTLPEPKTRMPPEHSRSSGICLKRKTRLLARHLRRRSQLR
jgi:hypothetical protein